MFFRERAPALKTLENNVTRERTDCNLRSEKSRKKARSSPRARRLFRGIFARLPASVRGTWRAFASSMPEKRKNDLQFHGRYDIVKAVNCNGGRFALQRGKSGLHRAGSLSSRKMPRGQPRGKESATENRPPGVFGRPARVKRRCKRPPGSGAIRAAWQAPSGARPNRGRCRCPRRYQSRVLAAQTDGRPRAQARRQNPAYVAVHIFWIETQ